MSTSLSPMSLADAAAPAQDALPVLSIERAHSARLFLVCVVMALVTAFAVAGWWRATERWASESRITYVKLSPDGTWSLQQDMGESITYYEATWRTVMYDWIERRYSRRSATIVSDWGIVWAMYSPAMRDWFMGAFGASRIAAEHAACAACPQTIVRARTHTHIDPLPTALGDVESHPIRTLVYATETTAAAGSTNPLSETRKVYRVTWRILTKRAVMSNPELLRYNPIGLEILEVEQTDDPN